MVLRNFKFLRYFLLRWSNLTFDLSQLYPFLTTHVTDVKTPFSPFYIKIQYVWKRDNPANAIHPGDTFVSDLLVSRVEKCQSIFYIRWVWLINRKTTFDWSITKLSVLPHFSPQTFQFFTNISAISVTFRNFQTTSKGFSKPLSPHVFILN